VARGIGLVLATCLAAPACLAEIPEAVPRPDAGSSLGYCASLDPAPEFCADFDTVDDVTSGWTDFSSDPPATFALDSETAVSPTRSARAVLTEAQDCEYAQLSRTVTGSPTAFTFGFNVRPGTPLGDIFYVSATSYADGDTGHYCQFLIGLTELDLRLSLQSFVDDMASGFDGTSFSLPGSPQNTWSRFELRVDLSNPGSPVFGVTWNGVPFDDWQPEAASEWLLNCHEVPEEGSLAVRVGSHCMDGTVVTNFDNVTYAPL
jgi:hypothetical protein